MNPRARFGSLDDPPASFVLRGVRIVDPENSTSVIGDLSVVDGVIREELAPFDVPRVDAMGLVAAPGFCDLHAHLRTPGGETAETIESGTRAAAHGGYTTVCVMPNTDPPLDDPWRLRGVTAAAANAAARVRVVAAATRGREGAELTDHAALTEAGAVAVSDDGATIGSAAVVRRVLSYLGTVGRPLIEHAEEPTLAGSAVMRAGATATRLGLEGWPASAELAVVERDLTLAAETGGWIHFTHLSTAAAAARIRTARAAGIRVTCDVTPHHLALTDAWVAGDRRFSWDDPDGAPDVLDASLAYDGRCRVNPPLGTRDDALALLAGVADGTIDAIATDHAPHPPERKAVPFAEASPGLVGLETALGIGLMAVAVGQLPLTTLIGALSNRPAGIIGERRSLADGSVADLVIFDPTRAWTVQPDALASRSANTPLLGMDLPGVVRLTVADGRVTYDDGLIGPADAIRVEAR
ncbi:MAG TPA: dihydroorotase [Candidatus Limnocylindria bacterium]|nr:dihydroorotase [Candidatus Limnocylindria bacterium]